MPKYDYKLTLSESSIRRTITGLLLTPVWQKFHSWLKSDDFIRKTVEFLGRNHIDLELDRALNRPPPGLAVPLRV